MRRSFLQLHIAILLAGFTGVLGRLITLNEGLLVWYRMFFSLLGLLALGWLRGGLPRASSPASARRLLGTGALVALHWVTFYGSIKYANVSVGLVCFSSVCFFTAVLEPLLQRRPPVTVELLLGVLVMVGIALIFRFDATYRTGILLGVASSLLAALFTVLNKRWLARESPETVNVYEMAGGWLSLTLLLPFYAAVFPPDHWLPTFSDFVWLLFLSLLCTVLAIRLSLMALREVSPFTVNLSYNLEPLYGILLAFLIYREDRQLGPGFYAGMSIIVLSVLLQTARVWIGRPSSRT
jgi:drug/metabolite transporter (DMT)-like permease